MGVLVETTWGGLEGIEEPGSGVQVFRGVPYARPPVGERRFRAPEPVEPWAGVRDATRFGPSAHQSPMLLPLPGMEIGETHEDCLSLNVWTPRADGGRRPVMVWIHGGAFMIGAGRQPIYDGAALARRGDVVVVTVNYRLGPLGFLFLSDLCPDFPGAVGNAGLLDQIAALRFVRENAGAFGGDPENITVFGESAGGMSVATLLGMPAARGLFRRAIAQSGAAHHQHTRESGTRVAADLLAHLGIAPNEAARKLRELPAEKLGAAQGQLMFESIQRGDGRLPFQPVVDGVSLPAPALDAVAAGAAAGVDLLVGTTRDEWKLFGLMDPAANGLDDRSLVERMVQRIRDTDAAALVGRYRAARERRGAPCDALALFHAIETDRIFRVPAIRLAETHATHHATTFCYRFDWESPALGGRLGACHAIELPFVFGTHVQPGLASWVGAGAAVEKLAARSMDAWLGFARRGDPSHPDLPMSWPAYDAARRSTFVFAEEPALLEAPDDDERACWDGIR